MYKRAKRSWMKHLDFILLDLLCIHMSFILAYWIRHFSGANKFVFAYSVRIYFMLGIILTIFHFCILFFVDSYSGIMRRGYLKELKSVLIYNAIMVLGAFTYLFLLQLSEEVSRLTIILFCVINIILMYVSRTLLKTFISRTNMNENNKQHVLVVTNIMEIGDIIEKLQNLNYNRIIVGIALITDKKVEGNIINGIPVVAYDSYTTYEYACRNVVDEVFIYIPESNSNATEVLTNEFLRMGITVHINLDMLSSSMPNVAVESLGDCTVMTTSVNVVTPFDQFLKRAVDIAAGIAGCIITGILYLFLAPAIKIADPGPVFFGQKRVGRNGRIFTIYKFRSMYQDAEERKKELMNANKMEGFMFKMDADPRIIGSGPDGTKKGLGHWIRALSLDEFPNFLSILKGDMSLVGTRPPTVDEYEQYSYHHKSRLAMKPGLTGMWQVSGRSDITDFEEIVALDTEYIKNWSVGLDIKIMFKTVEVVLKRKGSV